MNQDKLQGFLTGRGIQIPFSMLPLQKKWNLEWNHFIILMYLKDRGIQFPLNPKEIEKDLGLSTKEVMMAIGSLQDAHLLRMNTVKGDKGILEDYISLEDFYHKYLEYAIESIQQKDTSQSTVYDLIQQEFGRTLSPMEQEIIKAWLEEGFKDEIIEEAIKEAAMSGVTNLRYIDKILYEWDKKGIRTKSDVEKKKLHHRKEEQPVEVFEYKWFEGEDDDDE